MLLNLWPIHPAITSGNLHAPPFDFAGILPMLPLRRHPNLPSCSPCRSSFPPPPEIVPLIAHSEPQPTKRDGDTIEEFRRMAVCFTC